MTKSRSKSENGQQFYDGVETAFSYNLWDADMNQACVCDPGFAGAACSERQCPRGDDPLTNSRQFCGELPCHNSIQQFGLSANAQSELRFEFRDWKGRAQAVTVNVDTNNDAPGLVVEADAKTLLPGSLTTAGKIMYTIRSAFPEDYLSQVELRAAGRLSPAYTPDVEAIGGSNRYFITFTGAPGKQDLVEISGTSAISNSVAYVQGKEAGTSYATALAGDPDQFPLHGNNEELPCSGRGGCDSSSGLCKCFAGYFGAACEQQNALVM
jgi:hypothetical protein